MSINRSDSQYHFRTELQAGDLGWIIHLHGKLYSREYGYGLGFESYVAHGLLEFWDQYDASKDRVWIAEDRQQIIGFLVLMHRPKNTAQLRYFLISPQHRGQGLGRHMMDLFMQHLKTLGYHHCYLWTSHEQQAAIALYRNRGFELTQEKESITFGKRLMEQRFDLDLR